MHNATQWNSTRTIHCTTSTELLLSATDGANATWRPSFMLQQCCHYFLSKPCTVNSCLSGYCAGRLIFCFGLTSLTLCLWSDYFVFLWFHIISVTENWCYNSHAKTKWALFGQNENKLHWHPETSSTATFGWQGVNMRSRHSMLLQWFSLYFYEPVAFRL
jgi:hypothetical protein